MISTISVVTIAYNAESNIKKTLESVIYQTYDNIQYIIKDGRSDDDTNKIVKEFINANPGKETKHIISDDAGIYNAMNQAIKYCTGDWIIFLNAGDCFINNSIIEKIFMNKNYSQYCVLFGDVLTVDESGKSIWKGNLQKIINGMPFCHQACFVRRKILLEYFFNEKYKIAADYNQIYDMYCDGVPFFYLNEIISVFELDGISSTCFLAKSKEQINVIRSHRKISIKDRVKWIYFLGEACVKIVINKVLTDRGRKKLKVIYKRYFKHYQEIEN